MMKKSFFLLFVLLIIFVILGCVTMSPKGGELPPVTSFVEWQKLTAPDAEDQYWFGQSVAINGDYAIVGAGFARGGHGAAYIYRNQGGSGNWELAIKLTSGDGEGVDYFGYSVAIAGNYALVGSPLEDGNGVDCGAAYIYSKQNGSDNWMLVKKLTVSDAGENDDFGYAVAIDGDCVIVGASGDGGGRGAAYIFYRNQGGADNWGEVKKLTSSDIKDKDLFGSSASISGDYAIVGADRSISEHTAAFIFYRNQGGADNWGEVKKLTASDAADNSRFGISVAIAGDYALVGAIEDSGGLGAAYIYYRNQGGADNWVQVKKLTASDASVNDYFGVSLALSGDYALVGANGHNDFSGAAYIYYRNQGGPDNWGEVQKLTAGDADDFDSFGNSVALSSNYALVGAFSENGTGTDRGATYIFRRRQRAGACVMK